MKNIQKLLSSKPRVTFIIAVLIGVVLSYLHDIIQLISIPVAEWAGNTFIAKASNEFIATNLVNFLYQVVTFSVSYALAMALMTMLISIRTMLYPTVAFITHLILTLWWIPIGFIIGFEPATKAALPVFPAFIMASVVVFWFLTSFLVRNNEADSSS